MPDDVVRKEHLAVIIVIKSPGVRRSVRDNLKRPVGRVKTPDAAIQEDPIMLCRTGSTNMTGCFDSMSSIQPTVRPPPQTVDNIMSHFTEVKTIQ